MSFDKDLAPPAERTRPLMFNISGGQFAFRLLSDSQGDDVFLPPFLHAS